MTNNFLMNPPSPNTDLLPTVLTPVTEVKDTCRITVLTPYVLKKCLHLHILRIRDYVEIVLISRNIDYNTVYYLGEVK